MKYPGRTVKTGDILLWGRYPQGQSGELLPIEWQVLDVETDRVLLLARYVLDAQPYHAENAPVHWYHYTLRGWLNDAFVNAAFTLEEQAAIWEDDSTEDPAADLLQNLFGVEMPAARMRDRVFLLGVGDIGKYYPDQSAHHLFCPGASTQCTPYAAQLLEEPCWWLRSTLPGKDMAHIVSPTDSIGVSGIDKGNRQGVRPAMWLNRYPDSIRVCEEGITEITSGETWGSYETFVIPDGVTKICDEAFQNRASLKQIVFPEGMEEIGESAFSGCTGLSSVLIPRENADIAEWTRLDTLLLPKTVRTIGDFSFHTCTSLTSVVIPDGVTSIPLLAFFGCTSLTSIVIPKSVEDIYASAFAGCCQLKNIDIAEDNPYFCVKDSMILSKDGSVLVVCPAGEGSVVIPEGVTSIDAYAFEGCEGMTAIEIPPSVTSIEEHAFLDCRNLAAVSIPQRVTRLGSGVFSGCTQLASVVLPQGITRIEAFTFSGCKSLASVALPTGITSIDMYAFAACASLTSIVIPDGVTGIGNGAFEHCVNLATVVIPDSVTSIGKDAFKDVAHIIYNGSAQSDDNWGAKRWSKE